MNTTDERRFRLDLAQALDASAHDIAPLDTAALVGAGARRVRRRRPTRVCSRCATPLSSRTCATAS